MHPAFYILQSFVLYQVIRQLERLNKKGNMIMCVISVKKTASHGHFGVTVVYSGLPHSGLSYEPGAVPPGLPDLPHHTGQLRLD